MSVPLPTQTTARRVRVPLPTRVDVAVVGSSLGGLLAAARLSRRGLSVAVLDAHYVAGGHATMFARGPADRRFVFDVGVHVLGDAGPGGRVPWLLADAGAAVDFLPLDPDGFDRLVFPGLDLRVPWTLEGWRDRLTEHFPAERRGIDRWIGQVRAVDRLARHAAAAAGRLTPGLVWAAATAAPELLLRPGLTAMDIARRCTAEPRLQAALLGRTGEVGTAPARVGALAHLGLEAHFFRGGHYPRGGGQAIADALADAVERHGGMVALRRRVARLTARDGRVNGLVTEGGERVDARAVLCAGDVRATLLELLPPILLPPALRERARGWESSVGLALLSLGVAGDLRGDGVHAGNTWVFEGTDHDAMYRRIAAGDRTPTAAYITSATVKDPDSPGHAPPGHSTLQVMAMVPGHAAAWGADGPDGRLAPPYRAARDEVRDRLLDLLDRVYPAIRGRVVRAEVSTPVTVTRYTGAWGGTSYGLAALPTQLLAHRPGPIGPAPGLFLCGAGTRAGHGLIGSLQGGFIASERILAVR